MEETIISNLEDLENKKVKVYLMNGLSKEGILVSRKNRIIKMACAFDKNVNKTILFNLDNISMIEEQ